MVSYRYGFNGKEKDPEGMGGGGSTYDYGFRIYNPQIARFLSVDPLTSDYPWYTPYQFSGNMPIWAIDLDGLEPVKYTKLELAKLGITKLTPETFYSILSDKYDELTKQYWITKDENTGKHYFDWDGYVDSYMKSHNGVRPSVDATAEKKWEADAVMADRFNDKFLFNGQAAKRKEQEEKLQAEWNASRTKSAMASMMSQYEADLIDGARKNAWFDIAWGGASFAVTLALTVGTDGATAVFGGASMGLAADQVSGGIMTLMAINDGTFTPEKEYRLLKGALYMAFGESGSFAYDISSLVVGGANAFLNVQSISFNDIKGILNAVNLGQNTYDLKGTTLQLITSEEEQ